MSAGLAVHVSSGNRSCADGNLKRVPDAAGTSGAVASTSAGALDPGEDDGDVASSATESSGPALHPLTASATHSRVATIALI
ncbi:hypothetical protein NOK12_36570 [Nocardioides sp. OK12]|nr:hypothetical protein NOK12_36570 [Nocardioides sp. OK12]